MAYYLYVHRADEWHLSGGRPIRPEEWLAVVAADPELHLDPSHGPYFAAWAGPCRYPDRTWFNWDHGRVYIKNPDRAVVAKLLGLSRHLGARVQGDHGEFYVRPEDAPSEEEFAALRARPAGCTAVALAVLASILTRLLR